MAAFALDLLLPALEPQDPHSHTGAGPSPVHDSLDCCSYTRKPATSM